MTAHRVAPVHADLRRAYVWAVSFAREVGFPALERTRTGFRPIHLSVVADGTESA